MKKLIFLLCFLSAPAFATGDDYHYHHHHRHQDRDETPKGFLIGAAVMGLIWFIADHKEPEKKPEDPHPLNITPEPTNTYIFKAK